MVTYGLIVMNLYLDTLIDRQNRWTTRIINERQPIYRYRDWYKISIYVLYRMGKRTNKMREEREKERGGAKWERKGDQNERERGKERERKERRREERFKKQILRIDRQTVMVFSAGSNL